MKFINDLPILVTGFNRPQLLTSVLTKLNDFSVQNVWLFVDGPRNTVSKDARAVQECRELQKRFHGIIQDRVFFPHENLGCKYGMYQAICWFFAHNQSGVVLEDDLVFESDLLYFLAEGLEHYQDDLSVGSVTGYMPLSLSSPDHLFGNTSVRHPFFSAWGWASWANRWRMMDIEMQYWKRSLNFYRLLERSHGLALRYWYRRFNQMEEGALDTWDFQFLFTHFVSKWDVIAPPHNLVGNVGFGELATHTRNERKVAPVSTWTPNQSIESRQLSRRMLKVYLREQFGV
jgi:hypothetical protein